MKCIVLGAGVVGVTTAYYLVRDGHEVVLIDRNAAAADESSYANSGLLSPGHAFAWAHPSMRTRIAKAFLGLDEALTVRPQLDPAWWLWGLKFLGHCTDAQFRENTMHKYRICQYSHEQIKALSAELDLDFARRSTGLLFLFRRQSKLDGYSRDMSLLAKLGVRFEVADRDRCAQIEPVLGPIRDQFAGAVHVPSDESGSCATFSRQILEVCRERGADIRLNTAVRRLEAEGDRISGVVTDSGRMAGDVYVLAMGSWSTRLARTVGLRLPVQPVKGYSITAPVVDPALAPTVGGIDEEAYVGFSRQGELLRVAGSISYGGLDTRAGPTACAHIVRAARALFPAAADYDQAEFRACLRPQTPDGPPILGLAPRHRNLYLNIGQGSMGWCMSAGSSRIVADLIAGHIPAIDMTGLGWRA